MDKPVFLYDYYVLRGRVVRQICQILLSVVPGSCSCDLAPKVVRTVKGVKYSKCLGTDRGKAQRAWADAYAQLGPVQSRLYRPDELLTITLPDGSVEAVRAMDLLSVKELRQFCVGWFRGRSWLRFWNPGVS